MPAARTAVALLTGLVLAGCGSGDDGSGNPAPPAGSVLRAVVGSEDQPDEYAISLTDESGKGVDRLEPGEYTIEVRDLSRIHNFHLRGPGVDQATSVTGVEEATFRVTVRQGEYEFLCDPHAGSMRGTVTVG